MFKETELIKKSKEYATGILQNLPEGFYYHNLDHTREVVEAAMEIGEKCELNDDELEKVIIAAWFHDLGYSCNNIDHEKDSIEMMHHKFSEWNIHETKIHEIANIIESTKMPQNPKDLLSKVMCDADLYHLSTDLYEKKSQLLLKELNTVCNKDISENNWVGINIDFLNKHQYFTGYGKTILEPRKKKNLKKFQKKHKKDSDSKYEKKLEEELVRLRNKIEKDKIKKPDRGVETMFRITSRNHLTLSGMADNKANIMISINAIILSVIVSVLFRKFEDYPNLIIPSLLLVLVCLTTIVFAILATRPIVSSGKFTTEDIMHRKTNLLFFGNFHSMELDNYMWAMKEMMKDADYLYGSMIKDIYYLGIVLGKKYKMLRTSYTIFMFGFVISILSFIIAVLFSPVNHAPLFFIQ